ncbi:MAG: TOBE domain-containing protein [Neisseria sp.]|uniref:TOBE domain-containing protein n=1 Tax=Neisseria sp. TaxID=192066 RepID=UPI0026DC3D5A|nr:TOBE domain-containing protein [Neisseria sp.]MDO4642162.1 TOBE domain-containing protein [Neisseria sp.]
MKTSARNQLTGHIKHIKQGSVNDEITVSLAGGQELVAVITCESSARLALKTGSPVIALIKSSNIIIATDLDHIKLSARNQLCGLISDINRGTVNSVIEIDLGEGTILSAGITLKSTEQLNLTIGQRATALFKANDVILGVLA